MSAVLLSALHTCSIFQQSPLARLPKREDKTVMTVNKYRWNRNLD